MMMMLKELWHRTHAVRSVVRMARSPNCSEREAARGRAFDEIFITKNRYVRRLRALPIRIHEHGKFKRIEVDGRVIYWPSQASVDSLWAVLAEAMFEDHPHHFDSGLTAVRVGDRVLDIGACEGAFCLSVAGKAGRVVAVEPSLTMIEAMRLAAAEMGVANIEYVAGLVGSRDGDLGFEEDPCRPEAGRIVENGRARETRRCWTLDSLIASHFEGGIDYIKCDAEGADFDILLSGRESLMKHRPRIAVASYHGPDDFRRMQGFLEGLGYRVTGQGLFYSPVRHKSYPYVLKAY